VSQADYWERRYQALVPARLSSHDAMVLLGLLADDPERLGRALEALGHDAVEAVQGKHAAGDRFRALDATDEVLCECADPECLCGAECGSAAGFEWGSVDADWQYLCYVCAVRLVERGTAPYGEEAAGDA
jgi:hypothetical protein